MLRFTIRRVALSLVTLLILIFVLFMLTRVFPADPARQLAGAFASQETVDALTERYGFDDPLLTQLGRQYTDILTLDFGEPYSFPGQSVVDLVGSRLWNSTKLVAFALVLTIPVSILGGIIAARRKDTLLDRAIVTFGLASASIPEFVSAIVIQYVIGVRLGWFPSISHIPDDAGFFGQFEYLVLPALAIVMVYFGYIARIARAGTIVALDADYTRTAFMKGLTTRQVVRGHVLRNALQPTVAVVGTQIGYLFGGLVGLELVFNYPGLGRLIFDAARTQDVPLLQVGVLTVAVIFMICTLAADLLIAWMNPRARQKVKET
jgi:peptide/nickel transport system permease protein